MPVYEYRCHKCQKIFEYQQRMVEPAKTTCEECAGELERLISRSSFSFKGGGWYKDLYSSSKSDAPAESKPDAKPSAESKPASESKSDSAPAPASTPSSSSSDSSGGGGGSSGAGSAGGSTSTAAAGPAK
jgi:putative FmdB family regulatory protein